FSLNTLGTFSRNGPATTFRGWVPARRSPVVRGPSTLTAAAKPSARPVEVERGRRLESVSGERGPLSPPVADSEPPGHITGTRRPAAPPRLRIPRTPVSRFP